MRFGFVGPGYTPHSINADSQRTVNLYPEKVESGIGKNSFTLIGTPGLTQVHRIVKLTIINAGSGYTALDALTITSASGINLAVATVNGSGGITALTVLDTSACTDTSSEAQVRALVGGTGTGATVLVNYASAIKAIFYEPTTQRTFVVAKLTAGPTNLFELGSPGHSNKGELVASGDSLPAYISTNGTQLFITDSTDAFLFTLATNVLSNVTASVGNGNVIAGDFIDQYFAALCGDGQFYISSPLDGATWDVLDTAEAESSPDITRMLLTYRGQIVLMGEESTEFWFNSGAADFPFEPIKNATIKIGVVWPHTARVCGNNLIWVGRTLEGSRVVWMLDGYSPQRISNHAVENDLRSVTFSSDISLAWTYQQSGHTFYVLNLVGGAAGTKTWCYDMTTGMWHERPYLNGSTEEQHRARCHGFQNGAGSAVGYSLVGDRSNGKVYSMSLDVYTDSGDSIRRERRAPHIANELKRNFLSRLLLEIDPQAGDFTLEISYDGGVTFGSPITGRVLYSNAAREWRRLGSGRDIVLRVRSTAAVKHVWMDAYVEMQAGNH